LEATEVLKIKLGANLETDVVAWALEKNSFYSVRSAYSLLKDEQAAVAMAARGETDASGDDHAWRAVWKLRPRSAAWDPIQEIIQSRPGIS
jgi:hypothetical protein